MFQKTLDSQITADKNGILNRKAIDAIKSSDANVKLLRQAVNAPKTIEVTTAPALQGGQPKELVTSLLVISRWPINKRS